MATFEHDAVIVTLAERATQQVNAGLTALHTGKLPEAEVLLRAAYATLSSLAILLEKPEPVRPFRKLAIVGSELREWINKTHGGDDGNGDA